MCVCFSMKISFLFNPYYRERSGLVVECLTRERDQGAAGSRLTSVILLCP